MNCQEIMARLEELGSEQTCKTLRRHGAVGDLFGVKIGDLKPLQKKIGVNHDLANELYETGNSDAQYLAGLIADPNQMSRSELTRWMSGAKWKLISASVVAALAAESPHAIALAKKWMASKQPLTAAAGWHTVNHHLSITPDEELDDKFLTGLLDQAEAEIHESKNLVKEAMNQFVIALGSFHAPLNSAAKKTAKKIGKVEVDKGDTACKTPDALAYIAKVEKAGRVGRKKKAARC